MITSNQLIRIQRGQLIVSQDIIMGNNQHDPEVFNTDDWLRVAGSSNQVTLWENKANRNIHLQQHKIYTMNKNQLEQELDLYYKRKNHPRWVAALYFTEESSEEFCVSRSVAHIFIEKIPIRLSDLKDLPIPDVLHTYQQCLLGFQQFSRDYGTFKVLPQFIGVNEKGVVKVWAGEQWAQIGVIGGKINEDDMVRSIVDCIEGSTDQSIMQRSGIPIRSYLYRATDRLNFDRALFELKSYAQLVNHGTVPGRLDSLYQMRDFQQFMEPLLRSSHELYLTQHRQHNYSDLSQIELPQQTTYNQLEHQNTHIQVNPPRIHQPIVRQEPPVAKVGFTVRPQQREPTYSIVVPHWHGSTARNDQPQSYSQPPANHIRPSIPQPPKYSVQQPQQLISPLQINYTSSGQPGLNSHNSHPSNYTFNFQRQPSAGTFTASHPSSARPPSHNPPKQPLPPHNHHLLSKSGEYHMVNFQQVPSKPNHSAFSQPKGAQPYGASYGQAQVIQSSSQKGSQIIENRRDHRPIPESIIMELYKSQDRFGQIENEVPTKQLSAIRKTVSINEQPAKKFESATIIKDHHDNEILGMPNYLATPYTSNLQSIQELNSEHWKTDNSFSASPAHGRWESQHPAPARQDYTRIDPNDGKSSEDLLKYLKSSSA